MAKLSELIGKDLSSYKIEKLHEVWSTDEEGLRSRAIGAFKSKTVAKAFAGNSKEGWGTSVYPVTVLTDGVNTFAIENERVVNVFNDEEKANEMRQKAIAKLSPADRAILGL
ncbi:MAG TPA: hypothetical protein VG982_00460 [Candidatus Paceibacterota bacterium]|nr:hypothetical protein [Candidatus Paceibacterota bacterium]